MSKNNNNNNGHIRLNKLRKTEENFNNLFNRLEQAGESRDSLNNKEIKGMVRQTFDGTRDAILDALEDCDNNSGGSSPASSTVSAGSDASPRRRVEARPPDVSAHADSNDILAQLPAYPSSRQGNSDGSTLVIRSFETITLDSPDDEGPSMAEPISDREDQPILDVDTGNGGGRPERETILAMLRRMAGRVAGFFQWLRQKIKEAARKVWNKVCEAFACIANFFRNAWNRVSGHQEGPESHRDDPFRESLLGNQYNMERPATRHAFKYHAA